MLKPEIQGYGMDSVGSNKVLVVGNGESRKDIQLKKFNYPIIGCNALHREFTTNYLVCCDRRMADEAVKNPSTSITNIYVRKEWYQHFRKILKNKNIKALPDLPFFGELKKDQPEHWGSGCYAVLLAALFGFTEIQLLGFDLYSTNNKVNNIYKGTRNYSNSDSQAVDCSFWIYQIGKIFRHYPDKKFIIINSSNWKLPDQWVNNNVELRNIEQLTIDS